jgi:outer membrane protein TolC
MINNIFLIVAAISLAPGAFAKDITLREALDQALGQSPSIERASSSAREASFKKTETYSGFLPTLTGTAHHYVDKKYALTNVRMGNAATESIVPQVLPTTQYALVATVPLFEGFSSVNKYKAAAAGENAANQEFNWAKFKIEKDVTLAFYKSLANIVLRDVASQNLKVLQDHLKEIRLFKQSGMATNYDVLRVEVQVSNAETDLLNAEDNIKIANENLAEILGTEEAADNLVGSLPVLSENLVDVLQADESKERLDIQALKGRVDSLSYSESAQGSFWVPRLSFIGAYQYYNNLDNSILDSEHFRTAYQVGLQLNWNIFDGMSSFARSKQSIEQHIQAEKTYRLAELKASKDVDIWKRKFRYFAKLYNARKNDVVKSEESVRLAKEGRRVGARTNTDFLDAEADLYKSQAGAVNAQLSAIESLINLELSTGKTLYSFN